MPRILYCHCAYAKVVPESVRTEVLTRLTESGVAFEAAADLCELSARKDPALARLADVSGEAAAGERPDIRVAACYPRVVKWLFSAAGAPLPWDDVSVLNMRVDPAESVVAGLLSPEPPPKSVSPEPPPETESESAQ